MVLDSMWKTWVTVNHELFDGFGRQTPSGLGKAIGEDVGVKAGGGEGLVGGERAAWHSKHASSH